MGGTDVVEEAVVFVVVDEQDGLAPDAGVGGEGLEDEVDVGGSVGGRCLGVLAVFVG